MSRLIDADALLVSMWKMLYALEDKAEKDFVGTDNHDEWFYTFRPWLQRGHEIGVIAVNDAPTVDAVPVVRCKDCIYWNERETNKKGFVVCKATHMDCVEDDYCSFGEKVTE